MTRYIKYSDFSEDIKETVFKYFDTEKKKRPDLDFESAMFQWFEAEFEAWVIDRFSIHPLEDRRKTNRRETGIEKRTPGKKSSPFLRAERRKSIRRAEKRRKHTRFEIEIPVKVVEALDDTKLSRKTKEKIYKTKNISRGGLYFRSMDPFTVSSRIKVLIDFSKVDDELESIEAEAMVVRVEELENGNYGNSIVFEKIPSIDHRKSIDLFVFKNLVYQQNHLFRFY